MASIPRLVGVVSGGLLVLGLLLGAESLRGPGTSFPGFLVLPNRVVPSIGLPGWGGVAEGWFSFAFPVAVLTALRVRREVAWAAVRVPA